MTVVKFSRSTTKPNRSSSGMTVSWTSPTAPAMSDWASCRSGSRCSCPSTMTSSSFAPGRSSECASASEPGWTAVIRRNRPSLLWPNSMPTLVSADFLLMQHVHVSARSGPSESSEMPEAAGASGADRAVCTCTSTLEIPLSIDMPKTLTAANAMGWSVGEQSAALRRDAAILCACGWAAATAVCTKANCAAFLPHVLKVKQQKGRGSQLFVVGK